MEDHIPTLKLLRSILKNSRRPGRAIMFLRLKRRGVHFIYCLKQSNPLTDCTITFLETSPSCGHKAPPDIITNIMDRRILRSQNKNNDRKSMETKIGALIYPWASLDPTMWI